MTTDLNNTAEPNYAGRSSRLEPTLTQVLQDRGCMHTPLHRGRYIQSHPRQPTYPIRRSEHVSRGPCASNLRIKLTF